MARDCDATNVGCLACDLTEGRLPLPGGTILATEHWRVEHCVGPFGLGALIVKPIRHVEHLADLDDAEAAELGPLLRRVTSVVGSLSNAPQVYACSWSHGPVHVHFVVQPEPVDDGPNGDHCWGPSLQAAQVAAADVPNPDLVEVFADRARSLLDSCPGS